MPSVNGSRGLNFSGTFDVEEILRNQDKVIKGFTNVKKSAEIAIKPLKIVTSNDVKPLTEYQKELVRIKDEQIAISKQKIQDAKDDKAASLAIQEALKKERELIKQRNLELKNTKRNVYLGNSKAEAEAYNKSTSGANGVVASSGTAALISELNKDLEKGKITASEFNAEIKRLNSLQSESAIVNKKVTEQRKLSTVELAQEKLNNEKNAASLKNSVREMNAAKGSIEQRRAALIRLNNVYDNLSASERNSPAGQRLNTIVSGLTNQVKDLEASTGRAQRNVGNYTNSFAKGASKAFGALRTVANILPGIGIAGILAFAVEPIIEFISKLDLFNTKLSEGVKARRALNEVNTKGAQNAQQELVQLKTLYDTAKNVTLSTQQRYDAAKKIQDQYPATFKNYSIEQIELGKVDAGYLKLAASIIATAKARASQDKIAENSSRALSNEEKIVEERINNEQIRAKIRAAEIQYAKVQDGALNKQTGINQKAVEASTQLSILRAKLADSDKIILDAASDTEILNRRNLALTENIVKEQKKGADIVNGNGAGKSGKSAKIENYDAELKAQRTLQGQIDSLTQKGINKKLDADLEELANIDKKYADLTKKAVDYNKQQEKLDKEAADKKKKVLGLRVDTGGLLKANNDERSAAIDGQNAKKLQSELEIQKNLYAEFEAYKSKIGESAASERFADEIGNAKTYYDYIKQREDELLNGDTKAKGGSGNGEINTAQLKVIQDELAAVALARKKADRDTYAEAVQAAMTYQQTVLAIEAQYAKYRTALGKNATADQLKELKYQEDNAKRYAANENVARLSGYTELLEKIDSMTRVAAIKALDDAIAIYDKQYKEGAISAKEYYDKIAELEGKKTQINGTDNNPFAKLSDAVKAYKKQLNGIDKDSVATEASQKKLFGAVGEAAAAASAVISDVAGSLSELGIGGEGLQDALKGVSGILDGASSIANGIASGNPVDIVTGSIKLLTSAIQLFNTKDKKLQKQIDGYKAQLDSLSTSYAQLEKQASNAVGTSIYDTQAAQIENLKQQQAALTRARDAEASKKKKDQGVIDQYNAQIADIPNKIDDINKAISESLIQTNFRDFSNSLADAFTEAFKSGEDSAKAFDDVFNNVIGNAIKNSLKLRILDPIVNKFTTDLSDYAKANGNSVIGFDFDAYKAQLKSAGDLFTSGLEQSKDFFKDVATTTNQTASSTGIARTQLTEETGTRLEGIWRAQYELSKITNSTLLSNGKYLGDISRTALNSFTSTVAIEQNTANTVLELRNAIVELKAINANTKTTPTVTTRGAGI